MLFLVISLFISLSFLMKQISFCGMITLESSCTFSKGRFVMKQKKNETYTVRRNDLAKSSVRVKNVYIKDKVTNLKLTIKAPPTVTVSAKPRGQYGRQCIVGVGDLKPKSTKLVYFYIKTQRKTKIGAHQLDFNVEYQIPCTSNVRRSFFVKPA